MSETPSPCRAHSSDQELTRTRRISKMTVQFDMAGGSSRKPVRIRRGPATVRGPSTLGTPT